MNPDTNIDQEGAEDHMPVLRSLCYTWLSMFTFDMAHSRNDSTVDGDNWMTRYQEYT